MLDRSTLYAAMVLGIFLIVALIVTWQFAFFGLKESPGFYPDFYRDGAFNEPKWNECVLIGIDFELMTL